MTISTANVLSSKNKKKIKTCTILYFAYNRLVLSIICCGHFKAINPEGLQRQAQTALIISVVALAILILILIIVCRGRFSWSYLKKKFQPTKVRMI